MTQPATVPAATPDDSAADAEFDAIFKFAQSIDDGNPIAPPSLARTPDAPPPAGGDGAPDAKKPDSSSPASDDDDPPPPPADPANPPPDKKKGDPTAKPDQPGGDKSPYEKKREERRKEEEDRRNRSWQKLDEEKAAFRKEMEEHRRALDAERAKLRPATPPAPAVDGHGKTAADYDRVAKELRAEGNDSLAALADKRAADLRAKDTQAAQAAAAPAREDAPPYDRQAEIAELVREAPELNDKDNPVVARANALLFGKDTAPFFARAGGVRAAVTIAHLQLKATAADTLRAENEKLKAEVTRLTKATALPGSPAQPPRGQAPRFEDLSDEEQLRELERRSREADGLR